MKETAKKLFIILTTAIVVIAVVGFVYPFFTNKKMDTVTTGKENLVTQITNEIKKVSSGETAQVSRAIIADDTTQKIVATSTLPIYFGVSHDNLIDDKNFPDGDTIYSMVRSLAVAPSMSRVLDTTSFTAANAGYYVYFAWPTSFENNQTYSCKAITMLGKSTGTTDCFSTGMSSGLLFNTTDLVHRELSHFVDAHGQTVSYELYRAHYFISPGTTMFYKTF